jgi:hypothetical protein
MSDSQLQLNNQSNSSIKAIQEWLTINNGQTKTLYISLGT